MKIIDLIAIGHTICYRVLYNNYLKDDKYVVYRIVYYKCINQIFIFKNEYYQERFKADEILYKIIIENKIYKRDDK